MKTYSQPSPTRRRLFTAIWLLIALAYLAFFLTDLRLDFDQVRVPCSGPDCNYLAISAVEAAVLETWGLSTRAYALITLGGNVLNVFIFFLLGALILRRQGTTMFGWMVSLALVVIPVTAISDSDNVAANFPQLLIPSVTLSVLGTCVMLLFVYLLPNGRFYPRWAAVVLAVSLPIGIGAIQATTGVLTLPPDVAAVLINLTFVAFALPAVFQVLRYRNYSTPVERQQTKWIVFGLVVYILGFPVWFYLFGGVLAIPSGPPRLIASLGGWLFLVFVNLLLPFTIALAILRYRLWDIDLLIRRTLIYGFLTAVLALVYFGSVTLLQNVLSAVSGAQSTAAIVISTLGIAALFNPLRRRLQETIDRRFFRARYDAERSLARFAAAARDEVDVGRLAGELQGVVEETMQPERVSLWLR